MSTPTDPFSRRERQIMDIVYALEEATVGEIRDQMDDPPSYSAVRALVGTLEDKGHLTHVQRGRSYVYRPTVTAERASVSALQRVVAAFFGGSAARAATALLDLEDGLDDEALSALEEAVRSAREDGR